MPYIAIQAGAKSKLMDSHLTTNYANKQCIDCALTADLVTLMEKMGVLFENIHKQ